MTSDKHYEPLKKSIIDSTVDVRTPPVSIGRVHRVNPDKYVISKDILGLWQQTVCEIRDEIKAQETPALVYAKELCDKLEHSMCALAGGPYSLEYSIEN